MYLNKRREGENIERLALIVKRSNLSSLFPTFAGFSEASACIILVLACRITSSKI